MLRPKGKRPGVSKLPKPGTTRWTALRKAADESAVEAGQLSMHEACERYSLTIEEFSRGRCGSRSTARSPCGSEQGQTSSPAASPTDLTAPWSQPPPKGLRAGQGCDSLARMPDDHDRFNLGRASRRNLTNFARPLRSARR